MRKQDVLDMSKTTKLPSITTATRKFSRKFKYSKFYVHVLLVATLKAV